MTNTTCAQLRRNTFEARPGGFVWTKHDGERVEGPWSRVSTVTAHRLVVRNSAWLYFGVTLDDGSGFLDQMFLGSALDQIDDGTHGIDVLTVRYAGLHIVERLGHQLRAGQTLSFGPITLSRERLGFRKRSWALDALAGYQLYQGHFMLDVGPADAPALKVQVKSLHVPNLFALTALLDELRPPRLRYGPDLDLGTFWRPSASSHDPRYPSGRTRLIGLAAFCLAGLLVWGGVHAQYLLGSAGDRERWASQEAQRKRRNADDAVQVALARAQPVEPGRPWACDVALDSPGGVAFAAIAPQGVWTPRHDAYDPIFALDGTHPREQRGDEPWLLVAEVKSLTPVAPSRTMSLELRLVDTRTGRLRCSGEQRTTFAIDVGLSQTSRDEQVTDAIASALVRALAATRPVTTALADAPAGIGKAPRAQKPAKAKRRR